MKILVTAGNTMVPIDRVRFLSNIFSGRTGAGIAVQGHQRGHSVTLLTSHPEVVAEPPGQRWPAAPPWTVQSYRTFDDLHQQMEAAIREGRPDAVIHSAAVSDYRAAGIYAPAADTRFREDNGHWRASGPDPPALRSVTAGKVRSTEPELWLRLMRTPKLIDLIRSDWQFRGVLVKFKLEVGVGDETLLEIAEQSRRHSGADLMVANTLEGSKSWAYLGPVGGTYHRVGRDELAWRLLDAVENLHRERQHA